MFGIKINSKELYIVLCAVFVGLCGIYSLTLKALAEDVFLLEKQVPEMQVVEGTTLVAISSLPAAETVKTVEVMVTAYSSTVAETDDTPFLTASGELVRDGIVANNMLAFGTAIRLPDLFGEEVFIVKDRMHSRKGDYHVDIWFPSREEALEFGAQVAIMEVLN